MGRLYQLRPDPVDFEAPGALLDIGAAPGDAMTIIYLPTALLPAPSLWTPATPSGLLAWGVSDNPGNTVAANLCSQLTDKSGLGHHWTQGTAANQMKSGLNTINGRNVLDMGWSIVASVMDNTYTLSTSGVVTYLICWQKTADTVSGLNIFMDGNGGGRYACLEDASVSHQIELYSGAFLNSSTALDNNVHALAFASADPNSIIQLDGTTIAGPGSSGAQNPGGSRIGGDATSLALIGACIGHLCEVAIYDGKLGATDLAAWRSYCSTGWGTP